MILILFILSLYLTITTQTTTETTPKFTGTIAWAQPERTTLPQEDVEYAINQDIGKYQTMEFGYHNAQWQSNQNPLYRHDKDHCHEMWLRCNVELTYLTPVCAYNGQHWAVGNGFLETVYFNEIDEFGVGMFENYCDMYFENCRVGYRHWRILSAGKVCAQQMDIWKNWKLHTG